jgi:hypothetical protein
MQKGKDKLVTTTELNEQGLNRKGEPRGNGISKYIPSGRSTSFSHSFNGNNRKESNRRGVNPRMMQIKRVPRQVIIDVIDRKPVYKTIPGLVKQYFLRTDKALSNAIPGR